MIKLSLIVYLWHNILCDQIDNIHNRQITWANNYNDELFMLSLVFGLIIMFFYGTKINKRKALEIYE